MRTSHIVASIGAIAALSAPASAHADGPSRFVSFSNARAAGAEFFATSACIDTHVEVQGVQPLAGTTVQNQGVTHPVDTGVFMEVEQFDHCSNVPLLDAMTPCCGGPPPPGVGLMIARDLRSAALNGAVPLVDQVSNAPVTMTVHLAWTGIPPLTRLNTQLSITDPGLQHMSITNHGTGEGATATGTVSDGTTNYTPNPSTDPYAFISHDIGTFVHIGLTP
jgi:hypothetical protein